MKISVQVIVLLFLASNISAQKNQPIDRSATPETKALFNNLRTIAKNHTLFGHQHATEYGHGWQGEQNRSDVKSVTGSHPAVIGVDLSRFTGGSASETEAAKEELRKNVADTYNRGGVTTVAWHFMNPVSGGGFYWKDSVSLPAVRYIIPGGEAHEKYKEILKSIAGWANSVKGADGKTVPMIFRPYHEFDGDWFWWGRSHSTIDEFRQLWKFTVSYLRDSQNVHTFLYAFSPDNRFMTEEVFLERYPGDEWVDMVGMDNYGDMGRDGYRPEVAAQKLKIVSDYAKKAGKLAAFTETGLESIPNPTWWSEAEESISYHMPGYKYLGMPLLYFAAYKDHCSLFGVSKQMLSDFKNELSDFKIVGSTIHFSPEQPLTRSLLKKIIRARMNENKVRKKT